MSRKKDGNSFLKFCSETVQEILNLLVLDFEVICRYEHRDKPDDDGNLTSTAEIFITEPYHKATIKFYRITFDWWKEGKIEEIREVIIHELCHIITEPLIDLATRPYKTEEEFDKTRERVTDKISIIVNRLYNEKS